MHFSQRTGLSALLIPVTLALAGCGPGAAGEGEAARTSGDMAAAGSDRAALVENMPDQSDPPTGYDATADIPCGFDGEPPSGRCGAGVKRGWGEDGTTLVEITKPDGRTRAIFFRGTQPYGADGAEADGSAGWDFETSREDDRVTINYGPEAYVIADAFVEGG